MIEPQELIDSLPEESWFRQWMLSWPAVEMPASYLLFSAMSVLGACLGRNVYFVDDYRHLYGMLNLLLIGPSGIGKSSSMELARKFLLENLPAELRPQFIGGATTKEQLHADLMPLPHAILYASELGAFFNKAKYMEPLIPYVTELLDYRPIEFRTKSGGIQRIPEPAVTVVGGSTKDWLQSALPDTAVGGGFLPRFLIVTEAHRQQRVAIAGMSLSAERWRRVREEREACIAEFPHIVAMHRGPVMFEDFAAADYYAKWYNAHQPSSGHLSPFAARAAEMVKRLAMLVALSSRRDAITEADLACAIVLYRYCEQKLQEVVVPTNQIGRILLTVLESIPPQGASALEVRKSMRSQAPAQDVDKYLQSLILSGDVEFRDGRYIKIA